MASEHPYVPLIEAHLGGSSGRLADALAVRRPVPARRAVWVCACVAVQDAPTWLVVDDEAGASWCRVPEGVDPTEVVQAAQWCGGHAEPEGVLAWLRGEARDPWGAAGDGVGDASVLAAVRRRVLTDPPV